MPWVTKDGTRIYEPRLPKPTINPRPPDAPWPDPEGTVRINREREEFWRWWKRHLAEYFEFYLYCPRIACRRNKACLPDAPCHDEALEALKAEFYPEFKRLLREMPPPPDEPAEAEPAVGAKIETLVIPAKAGIQIHSRRRSTGRKRHADHALSSGPRPEFTLRPAGGRTRGRGKRKSTGSASRNHFRLSHS